MNSKLHFRLRLVRGPPTGPCCGSRPHCGSAALGNFASSPWELSPGFPFRLVLTEHIPQNCYRTGFWSRVTIVWRSLCIVLFFNPHPRIFSGDPTHNLSTCPDRNRTHNLSAYRIDTRSKSHQPGIFVPFFQCRTFPLKLCFILLICYPVLFTKLFYLGFYVPQNSILRS